MVKTLNIGILLRVSRLNKVPFNTIWVGPVQIDVLTDEKCGFFHPYLGGKIRGEKVAEYSLRKSLPNNNDHNTNSRTLRLSMQYLPT
jgi:hypothetical protein